MQSIQKLWIWKKEVSSLKTKVKETAKIGEEIVNKATVSDKTNPPKNLEEKITPQHKAGKIAAKKKSNK